MKNWIIFSLILFGLNLQAQVALSDQAGLAVPDPSALLDLQSTSKGTLLSRMSQGQRDSIQNPANGLLIHNTTSNCIQIYFTQQGWTDVECDCAVAPSAAFTYPGTINQYAAASFVASQAGLTYSWMFMNGSPTNGVSQTESVTWSSTGDYQVSLTVTDALGCSSTEIDTITVQACVPPSSAFTGSTTASINTPASFSATQGGLTYAWIFPSGSPSSSTAQSPSVTWTAAGTYNIQLITTNAFGCSDTSNASVTVQNCVTGGSMTFTNCGATGRTGPTQSQANAQYGAGMVTIKNFGIQQWTVPAGVCDITIEAWGAEGGDVSGNSPGRGARMRGDFNVTGGTTLYIVVGQEGLSQATNNCNGGGGGGGTFVYIPSNPQPLIVAGGGGGAYRGANGVDGGVGTSGATSSTSQGTPGNGGNGGAAGPCGSGWPGAGGAGWLNNGGTTCVWGSGSSKGGNTGPDWRGGERNLAGNQGSQVQDGSFGGGGSSFHGGGGGGGYSGGGGGGSCSNGLSGGGGGGSYNSGTNQNNSAGVRTGHGQVVITW